MEMIRLVDGPRRRVPGEHSHRDHDAFLNSFRPAEVTAQHRRSHDSEQVKEINGALNVNRMVRLDSLCENAMSFYFLFCENVLVIKIEHDQQNAHHKSPLRKQTQRPMKWHPAQESQE